MRIQKKSNEELWYLTQIGLCTPNPTDKDLDDAEAALKELWLRLNLPKEATLADAYNRIYRN
jgi:hypothetical protein